MKNVPGALLSGFAFNHTVCWNKQKRTVFLPGRRAAKKISFASNECLDFLLFHNSRFDGCLWSSFLFLLPLLSRNPAPFPVISQAKNINFMQFSSLLIFHFNYTTVLTTLFIARDIFAVLPQVVSERDCETLTTVFLSYFLPPSIIDAKRWFGMHKIAFHHTQSLAIITMMTPNSITIPKNTESNSICVATVAPQVSLTLGPSMRRNQIKEGAEVHLECHVRAKPWVTEISWQFEGRTLRANVTRGIVVANQSLILQKVTRQQRGKYTCSATNTEGQRLSDPVFLKVNCEWFIPSPHCVRVIE